VNDVLDRLLLAHTFLTRLPLPQPSGEVDRRRLGRAAVVFPVVGVTVGGLAALALWLVDELELGIATIVAIAVSIAVTGGLHETGLAATADALGRWERPRRLQALRDPRMGALGVLALVFAVLLRITPLAGLRIGDAALSLIAGHVLGRWSALPLGHWVAPAGADAPGATLVRTDREHLAAGTVIALAWAVPALVVIDVVSMIVALVAVVAVIAASGWLWRRSFGGVTGATYGATNQLVEIVVYVGIVAGL
jgi:adenosylcobinamide-GDP ribazoletransferase